MRGSWAARAVGIAVVLAISLGACSSVPEPEFFPPNNGEVPPGLPEHEELFAELGRAEEKGDDEAIDAAYAALEAAGVTFHSSAEIADRFPEAMESLDRAAPGSGGFLSRTFGTEGDRSIEWYVSRVPAEYNAEDYELNVVTTLTGDDSFLRSFGTVIVTFDGTVIDNPRDGRVYEDIQTSYVWARAQSARFVYVAPVTGSKDDERLTYIGTSGRHSIARTENKTEINEDGEGVAASDQSEVSGEIEPACYSPEPETVIRAYLGDESVNPRCLAEGFDVVGPDGTVLTTIDPIAPDFPR